MKKIFKVAIAATCLIATTFSANAQKVVRGRTSAQVATAPISVAVKDTTVKTTLAVSAGLSQINKVIKPLPIQDPSRAIATGIIKNETDENMVFGEVRGEYYLKVGSVRENPDYNNNQGGLVGFKYITGWDGSPNPWSEPTRTGYEFVITKVNDKEWKYTLYNIELNHRKVVYIAVNYVSRGDRGDQPETYPISNYVIDNAYYAHKSYNNISFDANFIYTVPTPTLNSAYTLPTIVIKKPYAQPN